MKQVTPVPIEIFVSKSLQHSRVSKIIEPWNMEPEHIVANILNYFKKIGLEHLHPIKEGPMALELILSILKNSPELKARLVEIQRNSEDAMMRRKRSG
jgi:hypothetical protein